MTTVPLTARKVRACAGASLTALALASCGGSGQHEIKATGPLPPGGKPALGMPLTTAVAQLFAVGFSGTGPDAPIVAKLRTRDWGVVVLDHDNLLAPGQAQALSKALRTAGARGGRPEPLLLAADPSTFPGVTLTPETDLSERAVVKREARAAGKVLSGAGVEAVFAPDADLAEAAGPAEDRGYSSDPAEVARLASAAVNGWKAGGVSPVVGHFPGEGAASQDPEEGPATVGLPLDALRKADLLPFVAVASTAPGIQLSNALYAAWDGVTPASLLPDAYRLLRRAGFTGAAMTGDVTAATAATGGTVARAALDALRAGADLVYVPGDADDQEAAYRTVLAAAKSGKLPLERIADALLHVSALKRGGT